MSLHINRNTLKTPIKQRQYIIQIRTIDCFCSKVVIRRAEGCDENGYAAKKSLLPTGRLHRKKTTKYCYGFFNDVQIMCVCEEIRREEKNKRTKTNVKHRLMSDENSTNFGSNSTNDRSIDQKEMINIDRPPFTLSELKIQPNEFVQVYQISSRVGLENLHRDQRFWYLLLTLVYDDRRRIRGGEKKTSARVVLPDFRDLLSTTTNDTSNQIIGNGDFTLCLQSSSSRWKTIWHQRCWSRRRRSNDGDRFLFDH